MNFDDLRGGEKPDIHDVLSDLEDKKIISDWAYHGDHPTCEKEFNDRFSKIIPNEEGWGEHVKDPSKFEVLVKREDITKKRADAGVELESQEVIETISKEYWA